MVSPPPNLTQVSGSILARRPHPTLPDWDVVSLAVDSSSPVPGLRDIAGPRLLRTPSVAGPPAESPQVDVAVRRDLLDSAGPGWHLTCRVKVTPGGLMAEPHPPGAVALEPPQPATAEGDDA